MIRLSPFEKTVSIKNNDKKLLIVLDEKNKPQKTILENATFFDFECESLKVKYHAIALVSIKNIDGKNKYKLLRIHYNTRKN